MALIAAGGMADGVEGSMDGDGVGGMTVVVSRDMDGSVDRAWTAAAVSGEWLSPELMLPGSLLPLMMR